MNKRKFYYGIKFPAHVVQEAHDLFLSKCNIPEGKEQPQSLHVNFEEVWLSLDTREEFLAEYPEAKSSKLDHILDDSRLIVDFWTDHTSVLVEFSSRADIESVLQVFDRNTDGSEIIIESEPLKVFIGHGRDTQWRDLKDHLTDKHGINVTAYEVGPRAGLSVKEVLQMMLKDSSFALIVLTGEDIHTDGTLHARENVIHELGLFQGKLGFTKAIAILEEGVDEFSNILGINQIRFAKGHIRETFGDIVATIKREFDSDD